MLCGSGELMSICTLFTFIFMIFWWNDYDNNFGHFSRLFVLHFCLHWIGDNIEADRKRGKRDRQIWHIQSSPPAEFKPGTLQLGTLTIRIPGGFSLGNFCSTLAAHCPSQLPSTDLVAEECYMVYMVWQHYPAPNIMAATSKFKGLELSRAARQGTRFWAVWILWVIWNLLKKPFPTVARKCIWKRK